MNIHPETIPVRWRNFTALVQEIFEEHRRRYRKDHFNLQVFLWAAMHSEDFSRCTLYFIPPAWPTFRCDIWSRQQVEPAISVILQLPRLHSHIPTTVLREYHLSGVNPNSKAHLTYWQTLRSYVHRDANAV